jgi:hypothetical protein
MTSRQLPDLMAIASLATMPVLAGTVTRGCPLRLRHE